MEKKYDTHLVTQMGPNGTLESHEVVVVPLHISILVKCLLGVRTVVTWWAMASLGLIELVVDLVDSATLRWIPKDLHADPNE